VTPIEETEVRQYKRSTKKNGIAKEMKNGDGLTMILKQEKRENIFVGC
jgi:ssDNA-binding Zn-finger/Zn-ribbon topoisomerase 1